MSLSTILDEIVKIESDLSITDPVPMSVQQVYKYVPDSNVNLASLPAVMNHWQVENAIWDPGSMMEVPYSVNILLAVGEPSSGQEEMAGAAAAFWDEILKAFRVGFKLGGTARISNLRGQGPTSPRLTWNGRPYIGIDVWLDILQRESAV